MADLILEGDPRLLANVDKQIKASLAARGLAGVVTVEVETAAAAPIPGELGFGEEIRKILVGIGDILSAGKDTLPKVAEAIGEVASKNSLNITISPDGTVRVKAVTGKQGPGIDEVAARLVPVLAAARNQGT
jgi:hypothetical protein